jgi:hypothetical protein
MNRNGFGRKQSWRSSRYTLIFASENLGTPRKAPSKVSGIPVEFRTKHIQIQVDNFEVLPILSVLQYSEVLFS